MMIARPQRRLAASAKADRALAVGKETRSRPWRLLVSYIGPWTINLLFILGFYGTWPPHVHMIIKSLFDNQFRLHGTPHVPPCAWPTLGTFAFAISLGLSVASKILAFPGA